MSDDDFAFTHYMEMPTPCPWCGDIVELDSMRVPLDSNYRRTGELICRVCYEKNGDDQ